jgi:hypothetical protein
MIKYDNSKIYKIESLDSNNEADIYIGSTTKLRLSQRMTNHRYLYKKWKEGNKHKLMSFDLFDKYGVENCKIVLIETYPCKSKDELIAREQYHIRSTKCLNKRVEGRTTLEYRNEHKEEKKAYDAKYRKANKEKQNKSCNEYYYNVLKNKEYVCECGCKMKQVNKYDHLKTKKHAEMLEKLKNI